MTNRATVDLTEVTSTGAAMRAAARAARAQAMRSQTTTSYRAYVAKASYATRRAQKAVLAAGRAATIMEGVKDD